MPGGGEVRWKQEHMHICFSVCTTRNLTRLELNNDTIMIRISYFTMFFSWSSWSLGEANSRLSYYDGMIQLTYSNGSQYNNKEHTHRSTLISFLCDPEAGTGKPDFQVKGTLLPDFKFNCLNCLCMVLI